MNHLASANRQPDTVDSSSVNPRHRALRSVAAIRLFLPGGVVGLSSR